MNINDFINNIPSILNKLGISVLFNNNPAYERCIIKRIKDGILTVCNGDLNRVENIEFEGKNITFLVDHTLDYNRFPVREVRHFSLSVLDPSLIILRISTMKDDDTSDYKVYRSLNELAMVVEKDDITFREINVVLSNADDHNITIKKSSRGSTKIKLSRYNGYGIEDYREEQEYNDIFYGNYVNELTNDEMLSLPKSIIHSNKKLMPDRNLIASRLSLDVVSIVEQIPSKNIDSEYTITLNDNNSLADIIIEDNALDNALNNEERYIRPLTTSEIKAKLQKEANPKTREGLLALASTRLTNYYPIVVTHNGYHYNKVHHSPIIQ